MGEVNIKDVQQKLYERLKPSGWGDKLKVFLLSDEFNTILTTLLRESQAGEKFTPVIKQIFRAFEECPYEELKVVMIGQDPYPKAEVADGIAFSCSNTQEVQASLRYMFIEIESTVYPEGYEWDPNLARWSNQGVLMLNTALTTGVGKIGKHVDLWKPFIAFLLDVLAHSNSGLVYAFLGSKAREWAKNVPANNFKCFATHPASAAYRGQAGWDSGNLFNQVNQILYQNNGVKITWQATLHDLCHTKRNSANVPMSWRIKVWWILNKRVRLRR